MDSKPYFTAPSLKFTMGSDAVPSGTPLPCTPNLAVFPDHMQLLLFDYSFR